MSWSYAGLLAAAATELVVRTIHPPTREQAWMATAATSTVISTLCWIVIKRNRPLSGARPAGMDAAIQPAAERP
jgi:hypothetical protein